MIDGVSCYQPHDRRTGPRRRSGSLVAASALTLRCERRSDRPERI